MELALNNATAWKETNVCCCCRKGGCLKDISSEYYYSGQKEVYENMLKDTFDIQVSPHDTIITIAHICECCITKLRDATTFKLMVVENAKRYTHFVDSIHYEKGSIPLETEVKLEEIKSESPATDIDFNESSYEDNEILANSKLELSQNEAAILNSTDAQSNYPRRRKTILKKCKIKSNYIETTKQKDWSKIIERRGSGPILRENSLKLLTNSTICVFQWNRSRYRCFCCKEPYSDMDALKEHTANKHSLKDIEKKIISQQNRLVKVEISMLNCKICDLNIGNLTKLKEHLIHKHDFHFVSNDDLLVPFKIDNELVCQICSEKFNVFRLLNIHMNKHYQNHVCHICGAGFSNLVFLNLHKSRTHKPIQCKICEITFANRIDKRNHEITSHDVKYERKLRFPCPYCVERFFQENLRVQHLVAKHGFKKPEYKCMVCSKIFITKSLCNNHMKTVHLKEKSHECDVCHNLFYTRSDVIRHKVTHTGEKNFACAMCNNPFASKDSLRRHMKRTHLSVH